MAALAGTLRDSSLSIKQNVFQNTNSKLNPQYQCLSNDFPNIF